MSYLECHRNLPTHIRNWLNQRGIPDRVIDQNFIGWNGRAVTIPIFNANGDFLFFKYRKDPANKDEKMAKYWYDRGHDVALYHWEKVKNIDTLIICEGEFDALVLDANGFAAITSTGGAGSFQAEWLPLLSGKAVYICMDNDEAGRQAAVKLLFSVPSAKLIVLPSEVGEHGDVTDYFTKLNKTASDFQKLMQDAQSWPIMGMPETLDEVISLEHRLSTTVVPFAQRWIIQMALKHVQDQREHLARLDAAKRKPKFSGSSDLKELAKQIPLENFYTGKLRKINHILQGVCPFHTEKTGSFTIYPSQNSWWCYGCGEGGDNISFVMKLNNIGFQEAIQLMTGQNEDA